MSQEIDNTLRLQMGLLAAIKVQGGEQLPRYEEEQRTRFEPVVAAFNALQMSDEAVKSLPQHLDAETSVGEIFENGLNHRWIQLARPTQPYVLAISALEAELRLDAHFTAAERGVLFKMAKCFLNKPVA